VHAAYDPSFERQVVARVSWRLLPFLSLLYIVACIDRINVGVARLQMPRDVPLDPGTYGFAAGLFFVGYFLFQVPSNLVLQRVGVRPWIACIMVLWGFISSAHGLVKGVHSFCVMRFLLGVTEAGFFPGILFYLTQWFRARDRARAVALFMTAGALAGVIGNPLSGALLRLDGLSGVKGWQWLFFLEGIPAVLLGILVLRTLPDRPARARWLHPKEREWLDAELEMERTRKERLSRPSFGAALSNGRVWLLCLVAFLTSSCGNALDLWLPEILRRQVGGSEFQVSLLAAVPYVAAALIMVVVAVHSDRTRERRWHVALPAFLAVVGFLLSVRTANPLLSLAAFSCARAGLSAGLAPFWTFPGNLLSGSAAAGGVALINSVGNLGGLLAPWFIGRLSSASGSFSGGLLLLATSCLGIGIVILALPNVEAQPKGFRGDEPDDQRAIETVPAGGIHGGAGGAHGGEAR
jgi:ACS family tartrate transporter-like MFS transporter